MNWRRGMMRTYLVLWFLWAATLTYAGILSHLSYEPPTKRKLVQVSKPSYPVAPADTNVIFWDWREVPTGPARLHFEDLGFGDAKATLGLAFALPAILLIALCWIVAGFRGPGASGG